MILHTTRFCTLLNIDEGGTFDQTWKSYKLPHSYGSWVECRYNAVQYNKILHISLQWRWQNINQRLNLWKHTIPRPNWWAMVSFTRILEKIDRGIMAWCIPSILDLVDCMIMRLPCITNLHHSKFHITRKILCVSTIEYLLQNCYKKHSESANICHALAKAADKIKKFLDPDGDHIWNSPLTI